MKHRKSFLIAFLASLFLSGFVCAASADIDADADKFAEIYKLEGVSELVSSRSAERISQGEDQEVAAILQAAFNDTAATLNNDSSPTLNEGKNEEKSEEKKDSFSSVSRSSSMTLDDKVRLKSVLKEKLKSRFKEWIPKGAKKILYDDLLCSAISKNEELKELAELEKKIEAALETRLGDFIEQTAAAVTEQLGTGLSFAEIRQSLQNQNFAKVALGASLLPLSRAFGDAAAAGLRSRIDDVLSKKLPPEALYYLKLGPNKFKEYSQKFQEFLPAAKLNETVASVRDLLLSRPVVVLPNSAYIAILSGTAAAHFAKGFASCPEACDWYEIKRGREVTKVLLWQAKAKEGVALDILDLVSIANTLSEKFGVSNISALTGLKKDLSNLEGRFKKISDKLGEIDKFANDKLKKMQTKFDSSIKEIEQELLGLQNELAEPLKKAARDFNKVADKKISDFKKYFDKFNEIKNLSLGELAKEALDDSGILDDVADDLAALNDKIADAAAGAVASLAVDAGLIKSDALLKDGELTPSVNESASSDFDPVRLHNGEFVFEKTDLGSNCKGVCLSFKRTYRSRGDIGGPLGDGWMHNLGERLLFAKDGGVVWLDPFGRKFIFALRAQSEKEARPDEILGQKISSPFISPDGIFAELFLVEKSAQKFFVLYFRDRSRTVFDSEGRLLSKNDADSRGFKVSYINGTPVMAKDSLGYVIKLAYDKDGHLVRASDSLGRRVDFAFDTLKRLSASSLKVGPESKSSLFSYFYDENGLLNRIVDAKGVAYLQNRYAEGALDRGVVVWQRFGSLGEISAKYERAGGVGSDGIASRAYVTGRDGVTRIYEHNSAGNLLNKWIVRKNGEVVPEFFTRFDRDGNVLLKVNPDGRYTKYFYAGGDGILRGNVVSMKECAGGDWKKWRFDDAVCRTQDFEYAADDFVLVATKNAFGRIEFSDKPRAQTIASASLAKQAEFDPNGNLASEQANGTDARFEYDELDNLTKAQFAGEYGGNFLLENSYDEAGRLKELRSMGVSENFERDEYGRIVKVTRKNSFGSSVETFAYDAGGRIVEYKDAGGIVTKYGYNPFGELVSSNRNDAKIEFVRDEAGRVTEKKCFDLKEKIETCHFSFAYEGASADVKKVYLAYWTDNPKNKIWILSSDLSAEFKADEKKMSLEKVDARQESGVVSLERDDLGRVTKVTDQRGHSTTFGYDKGALPVFEELANGAIRRFFYDERGRLSGVKNFDGTFRSISYDELGRLKSVSVVEGVRSEVQQEFGYDAFGRLVYSVDYNDPADKRDDVKSFYRYDSFGDVWGEAVNGKWVVASRDFANGGFNVRYPSGRVAKGWQPEIKQKSDPTNGRQFTLDENGRLLREEFDGGFEAWSFDEASNFTCHETLSGKEIFEADEINAYRQMTSPSGEITKFTYDKNGNLTSDGDFEFEFDFLGRLSKVKNAKTKEVAGSYFYDAANRRVKKITQHGEMNYFYFGADVARVEDSSGFAEFAYAEGIDRLLSVFTGDDEVLSVERDEFNNVVSIGSGASHSSLVREFNPYGALRKSSSSKNMPPLASLFGFASREEDKESGLYYFRNRYFSPKIGRFISPDPIGAAGGMNRYAYVGGRVTKFSDPLGLFAMRYHEILTSTALEAYGLGNIETVVALGNFSTDVAAISAGYSLFGYSQAEHDRAVGMHFDNLGSASEIQNVWSSLEAEVLELNLRPAITTPAAARSFALELGALMHQAQDFYSHSNWVEYWNAQGKFGADIPTFLNSNVNADANLYTGAWGSGANPKCPKHHDQMAKDTRSNPLFDQAMLAAQNTSSEILSMISPVKLEALSGFNIGSFYDKLRLSNLRNNSAVTDGYNEIRRKL